MSLKRKISEESELLSKQQEAEFVSPYFAKPNISLEDAGSNIMANSDLLLLTSDYFSSSCTSLAKSLLGCSLCRMNNSGQILKGKIVETESYPGSSDGASHSFKGQTRRNKAMFMVPGTAYVYTIYGMYQCFNISSEGEGAAVLIRALEPLQGEEVMRQNRKAKRKEGAKQLKLKDLCNGPSKLCQALVIDKSLDQVNLPSSKAIWVERGQEVLEENIVNTTRVGIEGTGEQWSKLRLRWYILGNMHVSVRDRQEEQGMVV